MSEFEFDFSSEFPVLLSMLQSMTWAFQITIVDLTTRPGSKVMTFQRHHHQPVSGQSFKPFSAVNLAVSVFRSEFALLLIAR